MNGRIMRCECADVFYADNRDMEKDMVAFHSDKGNGMQDAYNYTIGSHMHFTGLHKNGKPIKDVANELFLCKTEKESRPCDEK